MREKQHIANHEREAAQKAEIAHISEANRQLLADHKMQIDRLNQDKMSLKEKLIR